MGADPKLVEDTNAYCPFCEKETWFDWVETDDSWVRAGMSDYVSGYWECRECGWREEV
jgi:hypothetical protein